MLPASISGLTDDACEIVPLSKFTGSMPNEEPGLGDNTKYR
jgi:hypothetical protein